MNIQNMFVLQLMMFTIMGIGMLCFKRGIITSAGKSTLIDLIINLILPCNIIASYHIDMELSVLISMAQVLLISLGVQVLCLILSRILYNKVAHDKRMVLQYATICSNAGFLGSPVVEGIYGSQGLLFASVYLVPLRIVMWTAGLSCFTRERQSAAGVLKTVLTHPCIIATIIGFAWMVSGVTLPLFVEDTITTIGGCTTALSMLAIGAMLAEVDVKTVLTKLTVYYSFVRLVLIPGIVLLCGLLLHLDAMLLGIAVVLAGMPAGTTTAILASKYDGDEQYASKIVFLTTLLSMITIPVFCLLIEALC